MHNTESQWPQHIPPAELGVLHRQPSHSLTGSYKVSVARCYWKRRCCQQETHLQELLQVIFLLLGCLLSFSVLPSAWSSLPWCFMSSHTRLSSGTPPLLSPFVFLSSPCYWSFHPPLTLLLLSILLYTHPTILNNSRNTVSTCVCFNPLIYLEMSESFTVTMLLKPTVFKVQILAWNTKAKS